MRGGQAADDELLLNDAEGERQPGAAGAAAATAPVEGDEQEMLRLQDIVALIPLVSRLNLTLIEGEDDTRSWGNFLVFLTQMAYQP